MKKLLKTKKDLQETLISTERVFQGNWLNVHRDKVTMSTGQSAEREYIKHRGAAVVIAEPTPKTVLFVQQYRHPIRKIVWELPAGKRDAGESLLTTAKRELTEETGYKAKKWKHLGYFYPCIGYADERIDSFHATELTFTEHAPEEDEHLIIHELKWTEVKKLLAKGEITDGKTLSALLSFAQKYKKKI